MHYNHFNIPIENIDMPTEKEIEAIKIRLRKAAEIENDSAARASKVAEYAKRSDGKQRMVKARDAAASKVAKKAREAAALAAKKAKTDARLNSYSAPNPEDVPTKD